MKKSLFVLTVLLIVFCFSNTASAQKRLKKRFIVLGVDGLNVGDLQKANTPNIDSLRKDGAWTFNAKTVMPSSSSPNWGAMIMGATPDLTTIHANGWHHKQYTSNPTCKSSPKFFPSIFTELRKQHPHSHIDFVHQWWSFRYLVQRKDFSRERNPFLTPKRTMKVARRYFKLHKPELLFVHFDKVDEVGHKYGHGSPEYIAAVEEIDGYIGDIVKMLKKKGLYSSTYILVTADHGGIGHGHGGDTPEETNIPWILTGPDVKKDYHLTEPIQTYYTAPTIAKVLGIQPNECWVGKPVNEAFK